MVLPSDFGILLQVFTTEKVQVGNDQEKVQSERNSHTKTRGGKKLLTRLTICLSIISTNFFPSRFLEWDFISGICALS